MHGNTGMVTGLALLESLEKLGCSGTLALEQQGNLLLLLLNNGELGANHKLGHINALDSHDPRLSLRAPRARRRAAVQHPLSAQRVGAVTRRARAGCVCPLARLQR